MPKMERRAEIVWEGDIRGSGRLSVGSEAFPEQVVTFAARTEAADGKTSPEELIAAAHATCYAMAFSNTLAQEKSPPERLEVSAVCTLDRVEGALKITTIELAVRGVVSGIDQARFEELARLAEQRCPVSNALRGNVEISVHAELRGGAAR
ncbi:MAG: OsmC family peroxiredoxin [Chloroflexota bacterium]|nr:OsmC family peroxiredoxin [Chloroflexota bacterium]